MYVIESLRAITYD